MINIYIFYSFTIAFSLSIKYFHTVQQEFQGHSTATYNTGKTEIISLNFFLLHLLKSHRNRHADANHSYSTYTISSYYCEHKKQPLWDKR